MLRRLLTPATIALLLAACGAGGAPEPPPGYEQPRDDSFVLDPLVKPEKD